MHVPVRAGAGFRQLKGNLPGWRANPPGTILAAGTASFRLISKSYDKAIAFGLSGPLRYILPSNFPPLSFVNVIDIDIVIDLHTLNIVI